ncbi:MAG: CCA tRNA nucleotidyltransferase [Elusimicrobiaceae bacterium]|nr:CCA tRNA nucleotidyltransferase [Elusimicrobiaceae bacterium]
MKSFIPRKYKEQLYAVGAYANKLGLKAWVVGGAVRDFYLKRSTSDIDLSFDGNQESVANFCVKQWGGGKRKFSQFSTFRVNMANGLKFDMVRARRESYPYPGALPVVEPNGVIKDDLFRRDFTVNAWCFSINPLTFGKPYDPYGAQKDIEAGLIRILHDKSFLDDPTRMYRAVRFAGRFGWKLAPKTERLLMEAVREEYPLLLTRERFSREFLKVLKEPKIKEIFALMEKYDLLKFAYPGLQWSDALLRTDDVAERTGILVCLLGPSGEDFLRSLHLPKEFSQEILGAWKVTQEKMSPLSQLSPLQTEILKAVLPGLPPGALEPCFLKGREVKEMGLMGRRISGALDRVRRAQWEGSVKNHEEAVKLLKP